MALSWSEEYFNSMFVLPSIRVEGRVEGHWKLPKVGVFVVIVDGTLKGEKTGMRVLI